MKKNLGVCGKKVAMWTQAIYNSFSKNISDYPDKKFQVMIQNIAVVNIKKVMEKKN